MYTGDGKGKTTAAS
ncbi:MAG: hypothetical protein KH175_00115 [Collinsella sp.]|nr:hypothetical protein [Collinsella sp.]RGL71730.1 hypothetical protein DXC52_02630 [Collinsella sp. TF05-9AC]